MTRSQFVLIFALAIHCAASSRASDIRLLPRESPRGISPELRIREAVDAGTHKLAFLVTFSGQSGAFIHNPFGNDELGRDYQVVLVDKQGTSVGTVIPGTSSPGNPPPEHWAHVTQGGIIGRCFWACPQKQDGAALLPAVPEGDYLFYLVVSARLFKFPVRPESSSTRVEKWKSEWNSAVLDEPCCASQPVPVHVDKSGAFHLNENGMNSGLDNRYRQFEIDPSVSAMGVVRSRFWIVFERETELSAFLYNLAADSDGPDHWNLVRSDGAAFNSLARPITSKAYQRSATDKIRVPQWGIIGGTRSGIAIPDPPGEYEITAVIDESLYWDRVYDPATNTRRQPPQKEWPTVFRSEPRVVDVPVIPKSQ